MVAGVGEELSTDWADETDRGDKDFFDLIYLAMRHWGYCVRQLPLLRI
jgi:hypothetical protein